MFLLRPAPPVRIKCVCKDTWLCVDKMCFFFFFKGAVFQARLPVMAQAKLVENWSDLLQPSAVSPYPDKQ